MSTTPSQSRPSLSWYETWFKAITSPKVATYEMIADDPKASTGTAYTWVIVAAVISFVLRVVGSLLGRRVDLGTLIFCVFPVMLLGVVVLFTVMVWLSYMIGRKVFEGEVTYVRVMYVLAAQTAPMALITGVIALIPTVPAATCLSVLAGIYALVLSVVAIRAAHEFRSWVEATLSTARMSGRSSWASADSICLAIRCGSREISAQPRARSVKSVYH